MAQPVSACTLALLALGAAACHSEPLQDHGAAGGSESGGTEASGGSDAGAVPLLSTWLDHAAISSDPSALYHQSASIAVDFGDESVAKASLQLELESHCFPFEKWASASIPSGQQWPPLCDAFDRGLSISLDDPETPAAPPGFEVARLITPFGGPLTFETDATDWVNGLPGKHRLQVKIGTYGDPDGLVSGSHGEWLVSLRLVRELGPAPRRVLSVVPLVFSSQTEASLPAVSFETPAGTSSARLDYVATGHGSGAASLGCFGPAEEFCKRKHTLSLDGVLLDEHTPWRSDCASLCTAAHHAAAAPLGEFDYCAENPCGDQGSVRAARANWCPGSAVAPYSIDGAALSAPGPHEFTWQVDSIASGGQWDISATYWAFQ